MVRNEMMCGIVAAVVCIGFLSAAWRVANMHKDNQKENIAAALLALVGVVYGLQAIEWILAVL